MIESYLISDIIFENDKSIDEFVNTSKLPLSNLNKLKLTFNSVSILATFDWLKNTNRTSREFIDILKDYYIKYPSSNNLKYGKGYSFWIENGAKNYRIDYEGTCIPRALIIGYFAKDEKDLEKLITENIRTTHNTSFAIESSIIGATFVYLCKTLHNKSEILKHLNDKFNYTPSKTTLDPKTSFLNIGNANTIIKTAMNIVFTSNSFMDAINTAMKININRNLILCTTSILAEALFKIIPEYIPAIIKNKMPDMAYNTHSEFIKYLNTNKKHLNILIPILN